MTLDARAACELHKEHVRHLRRTLVNVVHAEAVAKGTDKHLARSYRTRMEYELRWEHMLTKLLTDFHARLHIDRAVQHAAASWQTPGPMQKAWSWIRKEVPPSNNSGYIPPDIQELINLLTFGMNLGAQERGAVQQYLGLAGQEGAAAGQSALDHMGLHKTFEWAHPQNMPQALYEVRGSKVIQNVYGDHLTRLSQIIRDATDPRHPKPIQVVANEIKTEWPQLQRYQVQRIARTETAAVWTGTQANAYQANGVGQAQSIIATGPTIGIDSEDPCDECVDAAADVHSLTDDLPPWHPNCRCEIVPVLEDPETGELWLPPDEPWAGGELPMCGSPLAKAALIQRAKLAKMAHVTIKKEAGVPGACATALPEPGDPFGGIKYEEFDATAIDEEAAQSIKDLRTEVMSWPTANLRESVDKIIHQAKAISEGTDGENAAQMIVARDNSGQALSVSAYSLDATESGNAAYLVMGVASKSGGARKMVYELAQRAHNAGAGLVIDTEVVSPQLKTIITDQWGFHPTSVPGLYEMEPAELKTVFKLADHGGVEEVPPTPKDFAPATYTPETSIGAPAAQTAHASDLPAGMKPIELPATVDEAKAKITSTNNKISGVKTRIKQANAKGDTAKLAELETRLQKLYDEREQLKTFVKNGGTGVEGTVQVVVEPPEIDAMTAMTGNIEEIPSGKLEQVATTETKRSVIPGDVKKATGTGKLSKEIGSDPYHNKRRVEERITEQLAQDSRWNADVIRKAYNYGDRSGYGYDDLGRDTVAKLIHNWAITSSDADWRGVAIQWAAKEELDLHAGVFAASYWNDAARSQQIIDEMRFNLNATPGLEDSLRAFVRAQYNATQAYFKEQGITELTVYRGLRPSGEVPWPVGVSVMDVTDNPMASWSTRISVSKRGHFYGGTMLRAEVPAEMVMGTPLTGFGCSNEYEVVVLNDGTNKAWVVREGQMDLTPQVRATYEAKVTELKAVKQRIEDQWHPDRIAYEPQQRTYDINTQRYETPEPNEYTRWLASEDYQTYQAATRHIKEYQRYIDSGQGEYFRWSKETELKAKIQEALQEDATLAGKPLKQPKARGKTTLEFIRNEPDAAEYGAPRTPYSADIMVNGEQVGTIRETSEGIVAEYNGHMAVFRDPSLVSGGSAEDFQAAQDWVKERHQIETGKPSSSELTPEKRARNKVSSSKHALKVLQQDYDQWKMGQAGIGDPTALADMAGGSDMLNTVLTADQYKNPYYEQKLAQAQAKYEKAQADLDALLNSTALEKAFSPELRALAKRAHVRL